MALTRITKGVIKSNLNYDTHNINSTGVVTATKFVGDGSGLNNVIEGVGLNTTGTSDFVNLNVTGILTAVSGQFSNVSIAGTLTYEDVQNVDSVGVITARSGVRISGGGIDVVGVSTFNNDIKFAGSAGKDLHWHQGQSALHFHDNAKLNLGTGNDLSLYHDGTTNYIVGAAGTDLIVGSGSTLRFRKTGTTEDMITASPDAAVDLFFNGNKRFETTNTGAKVTGDFVATGNLNVLGTITYTASENIDSVGIITAQQGIQIDTLTAGRVPVVGTGKTLADYANFTYDGLHLGIGGNLTIADKIIQLGYPNTHLAFPAANTFKLTTNNTERLTFTNNDISIPNSTLINIPLVTQVKLPSASVGLGTDDAATTVKGDNNEILHVGVVTARTYYGDGSNLTNVGGASANSIAYAIALG